MKDATTFIDELKDKVHDLFEENKELKKRINKAIEYLEESYNETVEGIEGIANFFSKRNEILLKILKGE